MQCLVVAVKEIHVCDPITLSLVAREILWTMVEPVGNTDVKVHGVGEVLWQRLIDLQCRELQKVTAMTKMLYELGLKEEATQLRGRLVCQSLSGK